MVCFWQSRSCSDQNGRGFDGLTGRSKVLRREHENQDVESLILAQISWKRTGGPALSAGVLESVVQANKNKDHARTREKKDVEFEW